MNIQIFGIKKCFDTKKAHRWFKERNIKFQFIDLLQKEMSVGEFNSVCNAVGGFDALINPQAKNAASLLYLALEEERAEKLRNEPNLMRTPIVRNGKQATIGYAPDIWETWN